MTCVSWKPSRRKQQTELTTKMSLLFQEAKRVGNHSLSSGQGDVEQAGMVMGSGGLAGQSQKGIKAGHVGGRRDMEWFISWIGWMPDDGRFWRRLAQVSS